MKVATLNKVRKICLSLPDTTEEEKWGEPHFCVTGKIFAGCGDEKGIPVIGLKLEMPHALEVIEEDRFWPAPYVGKHGWVSMNASDVKDWDEVKGFIVESFRIIAPKRTLAKLQST